MSDNPSTIPGHVASLDDFTRCEVIGCIWNVLRPATRCSEHGGQAGPEYAEADAGEIIATRHMNVLEGDA